jgi:polyisoprenoid-binding protein YceI
MTNTTPSDPDAAARPARKAPLIIGLVVVVLAALGVGAWWFFGQDTPAEVNLDTAAAGVTTVPGTPRAADDDLSGTWSVTSGEDTFTYDSATGTFAGFRIREELVNVGSTEAVGRTGDVTGSFTITDGAVTAATISVDMASITTDRSQRDNRVRDALEVATYPGATFTLTSPIALPADAASGVTVRVDAIGELTIKGVTRPVVFPLEARLVGDTIVIVGSLEVSFADYGLVVPSAPVVLSVADVATLEMQLLLNR